MDEKNIGVRIISTPGGVCEKCGAKVDQRYRVKLVRGGETTEQTLCRDCAAVAKQYTASNQPTFVCRPAGEGGARVAPEGSRVSAPMSQQAVPAPAPAAPQQAVPAPAPAEAPQGTNRKSVIILLLAFVAIIALAVGAWFWFSSDKKGQDQDETTAAPVSTTGQHTETPAPSEEEEEALSGLIAIEERSEQKELIVHCIDPETGADREVHNFSTQTITLDLFRTSGAVKTEMFSSDYRLLAGIMTAGSNIYPVWIDENGVITNAYEVLSKKTSARGESTQTPDAAAQGTAESSAAAAEETAEMPAVTCTAYGFDDDDWFYFSVTTTDGKKAETKYCRIPSGEADEADPDDLDITKIITDKNVVNEPDAAMENYVRFGKTDYAVFSGTDTKGKPFSAIDKVVYNSATCWLRDGSYYYNYVDDEKTAEGYDVRCVKKGSLSRNSNSELADDQPLQAPEGNTFDAIVSPREEYVAYCLLCHDENGADTVKLRLFNTQNGEATMIDVKTGLTFAYPPEEKPVNMLKLCDWL